MRACSPRAAFDAAPRVAIFSARRASISSSRIVLFGWTPAFCPGLRSSISPGPGRWRSSARTCHTSSGGSRRPSHPRRMEFASFGFSLSTREPAPRRRSSAPAVPEVPAERAAAVEARSPPPTGEVEPEEERVTLPAPQPFPPDPVPRPDPPLPLPEPSPVPEPQPEPEPEPEEPEAEAAMRAELEETRRTLDRARAETEAFVRSRTEELTAKEQGIAGREAAIASKEEVVEARAHAAAERLAGLEKDTARREVLRFLTTVPGVSLDQADVIATAFPDMASLGAADAKALAQCKGVTAALARAIRLELAPGEVEQEQRATRLREEAQGFIEEGEYRAALDCYDRLLREAPEDVAGGGG